MHPQDAPQEVPSVPNPFPATVNPGTDQPFEISRVEFEALYDKFREIKHQINNTLAVIMALSELGQRNPTHYEKLAKAVLHRGPDVVQNLQEFQAMLQMQLDPNGTGIGTDVEKPIPLT